MSHLSRDGRPSRRIQAVRVWDLGFGVCGFLILGFGVGGLGSVVWGLRWHLDDILLKQRVTETHGQLDSNLAGKNCGNAHARALQFGDNVRRPELRCCFEGLGTVFRIWVWGSSLRLRLSCFLKPVCVSFVAAK